jgi:hypothetical protein
MAQDQTSRSMRRTLLISLLILAFGVGVLVLRQLALRRQVQIADQQNQQLTAQTTALAQRLEAAEARIETLQNRAAHSPLPGSSLSTSMPSAKVIGPPNTLLAGDVPTAWAPRSPDGGAEWLAIEFGLEVEMAEVRIRESYNPGAIVRVAALVNGQETTLWEGASKTGPAPRDFVIRAPPGLRSRNIVVHLDTARVPGWNEIDAVELLGRDGTRQWASSATASSSYAEATSSFIGQGTALLR